MGQCKCEKPGLVSALGDQSPNVAGFAAMVWYHAHGMPPVEAAARGILIIAVLGLARWGVVLLLAAMVELITAAVQPDEDI